MEINGNTPLLTPSTSALPSPTTVGAVEPGFATGFQQILKEIKQEGERVSVKRGDTLVGIVREQQKKWNIPLTDREAYRQALALAKANGIANPDLIRPGQALDVGSLKDSAIATSTLAALQSKASSRSGFSTPTEPGTGSRDLLDQTLSRAVNKGYIGAQEVQPARQKILNMAQEFGFEPDHFAMMTLIESDGMNPKASNGICHGVIQFCEGASKGAASVGMAGRAQQILGMGLVKQLELVEKYFKDLGLTAKGGKMSLDDLYLSVLSPAARAETRPHTPLAIAGMQAKDLYADHARGRVITRQSIVTGLNGLAQRIFPDWQTQRPPKMAQAQSDVQP